MSRAWTSGVCHECGSRNVVSRTNCLGLAEERCLDCRAFVYWQADGFQWFVTARVVRLLSGTDAPAAQTGEIDIPVPALAGEDGAR